jgi:hypothetical protein
MFCNDVLFYISDFLDDKSAFNLFLCKKNFYLSLKNNPHRYTIKKIVKKIYKYRIKKYLHPKNETLKDLPESITHLYFCDHFNQPLNSLPPNLTYLYFGLRFNQPLPKLPSTLTHLYFGGKFNKPLIDLPISLKRLAFGWSFNHPLKDLPKTLEIIVLGRYFKQSKNFDKKIQVFQH